MLIHGTLVCPNCDALVYAQRLTDLSIEAQREEAANPVRAATIWQQALPLLPPESQQYQQIAQRIGMLTSRLQAAPPAGVGSGEVGAAEVAARPVPKNDPWPLALTKTLGSMLISIVVYTMLFSGRQGLGFGLKFATGFVLLMLVHELGHSMAMRYYRLSASPPIFIPFLGAVINLRQLPRNALEEAIVGIGGPVTGTIAAGVTYLIYLQTGSELFLKLSFFGFLLNLFNMLPVPPLDGGRITAAVSPWIWIAGLVLVVLYFILGWLANGRPNFLLVLLLLMAWPRVQNVLTSRQRDNPYYRIGRLANVTMGVAYVVLGGLLAMMYFLCQRELVRFGPGFFG